MALLSFPIQIIVLAFKSSHNEFFQYHPYIPANPAAACPANAEVIWWALAWWAAVAEASPADRWKAADQVSACCPSADAWACAAITAWAEAKVSAGYLVDPVWKWITNNDKFDFMNILQNKTLFLFNQYISPSIAESFKIPVEPNPSWLLDDESNEGLEEDPDKPLEACNESVDVGGRMVDSPLPGPIEDDFPPSKYDVSFWLFNDDLKSKFKID